LMPPEAAPIGLARVGLARGAFLPPLPLGEGWVRATWPPSPPSLHGFPPLPLGTLNIPAHEIPTCLHARPTPARGTWNPCPLPLALLRPQDEVHQRQDRRQRRRDIRQRRRAEYPAHLRRLVRRDQPRLHQHVPRPRAGVELHRQVHELEED